MRWRTLADREPHPINWIWLWAPAALFLLILGTLLAGEWLEKQKRQLMGPSKEWRRWLAWYPVRIECGKTVWLEWVERRILADGWVDHRLESAAAIHKQPGAT